MKEERQWLASSDLRTVLLSSIKITLRNAVLVGRASFGEVAGQVSVQGLNWVANVLEKVADGRAVGRDRVAADRILRATIENAIEMETSIPAEYRSPQAFFSSAVLL